MSIKKVPQKFETSDGQEFDNEKDALLHQKMIDTRNNYKTALREFCSLLAETQKTADGEPFKLGLRSYYVIRHNWPGLPVIQRVDFGVRFWQEYSLDEDNRVTLIVRDYERQREQNEYRTEELYLSEKAAKKALLAAQDARMEEFREQVEELRAEVNRRKP
jgi:hypothetical protein